MTQNLLLKRAFASCRRPHAGAGTQKKAANGPYVCGFLYSKLLGDLHDRDLLAVLAQTLKLHLAGLQGKQGVIAALAHVDAGVDVRAALADQDIAGQHELTVGTRLTPRRLASESRPLRVEPTPFLWAKNCRPIFSMSYTSKTIM